MFVQGSAMRACEISTKVGGSQTASVILIEPSIIVASAIFTSAINSVNCYYIIQ